MQELEKHKEIEPCDIDKILLKLKFSMVSEKLTSQEWEIVMELYHEAISHFDVRDINDVISDYLRGVHGKFMPKPVELAEEIGKQRYKRLSAISKLTYSLARQKQFKPK